MMQLSNAVKMPAKRQAAVQENLVFRVIDWEGLHCVEALIDGSR